MLKLHQWDRPRHKPGRQPKCTVCGQGASSWFNEWGWSVVDAGTWGSHVPVRHVHTFFCPQRWTGAREFYRNSKGWVAEGPPVDHPAIPQEEKDRYRSKPGLDT